MLMQVREAGQNLAANGGNLKKGKKKDMYVIRSHYVTMVDNNRDRSHIARRPVYAFLEYVFFISLRSYHVLLLSCQLQNCRLR
jgi:hypothetical protein